MLLNSKLFLYFESLKNKEMNATHYEFGFKYEITERDNDVHILRIDLKTGVEKDFLWTNGLDTIDYEVRELDRREMGRTYNEIKNAYLAEICIDNAHEWKEATEEDVSGR